MTEILHDHMPSAGTHSELETRYADEQESNMSTPSSAHINNVVSTRESVTEIAEQPRFSIETYRSCDLSPELIREFADFYREIFSNEPYNQFLFHIDDPLSPISPQEAFGKPNQKYFSLEELDSLEPPEGVMRWMDPEKVQDITEKKLLDDSFITRLASNETGKTVGLVFGRKASLRDIFETEEMKNPLLFADYDDDSLLADEDQFFDKMKYHFNVCPENIIFYISCLAIHPEARGFDSLYTLMNNFFRTLSKEELDLFLFAEIPDEGAAADIDRATMEREVFGILENGHPVVACTLEYYAKHFLMEKKELFGVLKKHLKEKRQICKNHPKNNNKIEVMNETKFGRAVFATADIQAGETIGIFAGEKYRGETALDLPNIMVDHAIQVGSHEYVHGHKQLAELINHSCEPNCGIRNHTEVFAMRDIQEGEQITWDYRMSEDSNWKLDCQCGSIRCTGYVEGFTSLPDDIKMEYLKKGAISEWLI